MKPRLVILLALVVLALVIIFQNAQEATFRVLFWSVQTTQIFLIVLMVAFGFVIGFTVGKLTGRVRK